jgi:hypothetical protein
MRSGLNQVSFRFVPADNSFAESTLGLDRTFYLNDRWFAVGAL